MSAVASSRMAVSIRPAAATRLRQAQLPQRCSRNSPRLLVTALARRSSSNRTLSPTVDTPAVALLEKLYLAASMPPALLTALTARHQPDQQDAAQRHLQQLEHHDHDEDLCGRILSVEDAIHEAGTPAEAPAAAPGMLGQLLDKLPISPRTRGILMLNLLVLLVATNWVVVKDVGASFDPFGFAFLRFAVAAAAFTPFMRAASKDKRIVAAGVELGIWTAAGYLTQSAGLLTTDASRASFLSTFTVLVVPFLAGITGRGVSMVTLASCTAALVGVGLLEQSGAPPGIGDVWSFLSAIAFGVQMFRTEHHARTLGSSSNLPLMSVVLTTTMALAGVAAVAAHPSAFVEMLQNPSIAGHMLTSDTFPWQQVLYCGLLTTDLALILEVFALQNVSSVDAAIIYTLEPVLGAGLAWMMLGERLGATGLAGAGIILASSLATQVLGSGEKEGEEQQQVTASQLTDKKSK